MAGPTGRVLHLLETLQNGGTHTAAELARRLDVDERTVRRYVEHLVDLEVPIWPVRGRAGGYRLAPGYRLPPLMLTDDEAIAVLLGLVAATRAPFAAASVEATDSATAKVRRVLPKPLAERVDAVLDAVELTSSPTSAPPRPQLLMLLSQAVRDHRAVTIDYTDHSGIGSTRTIDPYGIVSHHGRWYVVAADSADDQERILRVDRIVRATPQRGTFAPPTDLDPRQRLLDALATAAYKYSVSVLIPGPVDTTLVELRERLPASVVRLEPCETGVRLRIQAERLDWVPGLLVGLDRPFWVEEPDELRQLLRTVAQRLTDASA